MSDKKLEECNCLVVPTFVCVSEIECDGAYFQSDANGECSHNACGMCLNPGVKERAFIDFMRVNVKGAEKRGIEL